MKKFRFSLVTLAFIIAIGASAFKIPSSSAIHKAADEERWFRYNGSTGGENTASNYSDLGTSYTPESACPEGSDLCVIKVLGQQANSMSPYFPESTALNALQPSITSAESAQQNDGADGVYVKGE